MASLTWAMVTDATGQVAEVLHVPNRAGQGRGRRARHALHPDLQAALVMLQTRTRGHGHPRRRSLFLERGGGLSPATVRLWFHRLYTSLTHGRLFVAFRAPDLHYPRCTQSLPGWGESSGRAGVGWAYDLAMTQRYIEGDTEAKRKLVALLSIPTSITVSATPPAKSSRHGDRS